MSAIHIIIIAIVTVMAAIALFITSLKPMYKDFIYPHVHIESLYPDAKCWIETLSNPDDEIKLRFDKALRDWDYEFKSYIDNRIFWKQHCFQIYNDMRNVIRKKDYPMFVFQSGEYSLSEMFGFVEKYERDKEIYAQYANLVKKHSRRYAFMLKFMSNFNVDANSLYAKFQVRCSNTHQYNNFNFNKCLLSYLKEHPSYVTSVQNYYQAYEQYTKSNIPELIKFLPNVKCDMAFLRRMEQSMCSEVCGKWVLDDDLFTVIVLYSSPGGRNHYPPKSMSFDLKTIIRICGKLTTKDERKRTVTAKQRQRILRRDNFTCQLCGAKGPGAGGVAVLHVDHIKPFSKGGSDDDSNLWTLCSDCNLGKSNKYDDSNIAIKHGGDHL